MIAPIEEGGSFEYSCTLVDRDGVAVPLASLTSLTITLYDKATNAVINSREDQNVKNANNGTFHATTGGFTMLFEADDLPIVNDALPVETHVALFRAVWGTASKNWDIDILVRNLRRVTV